jgi:hypothetical protein
LGVLVPVRNARVIPAHHIRALFDPFNAGRVKLIQDVNFVHGVEGSVDQAVINAEVLWQTGTKI